MSRIRISLLPLGLVGLAAFSLSPAAPAGPARCEVRMEQAGQGLRVEGIVRGRPGASASYQLELQKFGRSGDSDVSQGGAFAIPASGSTVVSESDVNLDRGDTAYATMRIAGEPGALSCERRYVAP